MAVIHVSAVALKRTHISVRSAVFIALEMLTGPRGAGCRRVALPHLSFGKGATFMLLGSGIRARWGRWVQSNPGHVQSRKRTPGKVDSGCIFPAQLPDGARQPWRRGLVTMGCVHNSRLDGLPQIWLRSGISCLLSGSSSLVFRPVARTASRIEMTNYPAPETDQMETMNNLNRFAASAVPVSRRSPF
jgi:hypothetical protein